MSKVKQWHFIQCVPFHSRDRLENIKGIPNISIKARFTAKLRASTFWWVGQVKVFSDLGVISKKAKKFSECWWLLLKSRLTKSQHLWWPLEQMSCISVISVARNEHSSKKFLMLLIPDVSLQFYFMNLLLEGHLTSPLSWLNLHCNNVFRKKNTWNFLRKCSLPPF